MIIENLVHFNIGGILVTILRKDNPGHYCIYMYVYFKEVMVRCQKSNA